MAKFVAVKKYAGFDDSSPVPWQMVPVGGVRYVRLIGADSDTVSSSDSSVATVTDYPGKKRTLKITGKKKGKCEIRVGSAGPYLMTLDVDVKPKKTVRTAFHYINDGKKQKTKRRIKDVDKLISGVNAVMKAQANVEVTKKSAKELKMAVNLGKIVRFSSHLPTVNAKQHEWDDVTKHADSSADWNVFFVREYEQDATPFKDNTEAGTLGGNTLMEDKTDAKASLVLAHELGHHLGADHPGHKTKHLMHDTTTWGRLLTKADINLMNPS